MKKNSIRKNMDNLTSLWRTVGEQSQSHHLEKDFEWSDIEYSQWPNRLWFRKVGGPRDLNQTKEVLESANADVTISFMDIGQSIPDFEGSGFTQVSELVGMSTRLEGKYEAEEVELLEVETKADTEHWSILFEQAFGYHISPRLLFYNYPDTSFYRISKNGKMAGTVIVHFTDKVVGIHAMGVVPDFRREGLARQVMNNILYLAKQRGCELATLQASAMGKQLYVDLGFQEEFLLKNYRLKE